MTAIVLPEDVPELLRPGMTVLCLGGMAHPQRLIDAINQCPESTRGVRFLVTRPPGFPEPWLRAPGGRIVTFFGEHSIATDLLPMQYRRIYDYLEREPIDLVLAQLAPPDESRQCSLGLGVDFLPAVLERAVPLYAELNRALPSPPGTPSVPLERCELVVDGDRPPPVVERHGDEVSRAIGGHVAGLIQDGDCLQTGVGAIPEAVLGSLAGKRDLGFHSGMLGDGVLDLIEAGAITGARKTRDRDLLVAGFVFGSQRLYRWAASSQALSLRPVSYTHDPEVIASLDGFTAINSAIEVDLLGQVNAEQVRGRQVSGTGGAIDFCRGAARSRRGRSIVALPSTAGGGAVSRIVASLAPSVATLTRTDVDYVITEHGVARLSGRTVEERAEALVAVAAPEHREELGNAWGA